MGLEASGETRALNGILSGAYLSLHTGVPTAGSNEVTGGSYARMAFTPYNMTGNNPTTARNTNIIQFPVASAYWGIVTHVGIYDAASGGNLIGWEAVSAPKEIDVGDIARFPVSGMQVTAN